MPKFKLALLNKNLAFLYFFLVNPDDDFDMDKVITKVEESDDEMENLAPAPKRGRGRGSRGKQSTLESVPKNIRFGLKNDGEMWSRKIYFEIPPCGKIVILITEFVILGTFMK